MNKNFSKINLQKLIQKSDHPIEKTVKYINLNKYFAQNLKN